ncbi:hypothetical protein CcaCcLH18_13369 [Colletotrichum camelliae]|nr:hypothetical protein CcaCcLH18_13369 [Colletotrichum camelliae]
MSPSGLFSCPPPTDSASTASANTTQDSNSNSSDHAPLHCNNQTTNDIRAMIRIFETYAGPFAVGTVAELLGRASYSEDGKWIILHWQSAHALSVSEAKVAATSARGGPSIALCYCFLIACPFGNSVTSVVGGIDDFELRVYLEGSLTGSFGLQLPQVEEE